MLLLLRLLPLLANDLANDLDEIERLLWIDADLSDVLLVFKSTGSVSFTFNSEWLLCADRDLSDFDSCDFLDKRDASSCLSMLNIVSFSLELSEVLLLSRIFEN